MIRFALCAMLLAPGAAQADPVALGAARDWSAFGDNTPVECWAVTRSVIDGPEGADAREVLLYASRNAAGDALVSFQSPSDSLGGDGVTLDIEGAQFDLASQDGVAWSTSADQTAAIVDAMRASSELEVFYVSSKEEPLGVFSLMGFTATYEIATRACGESG